MRMTNNKMLVLEALAHINKGEGLFPPYNAASVQWVLKEELDFGIFDLSNLTRTLKALVDQGLVKSAVASVDVSGDTGCINRWYEREMTRYWPADLDLDAMVLHYKGTPEEQELRQHNILGKFYGDPILTMDEFRAYKARKVAALK